MIMEETISMIRDIEKLLIHTPDDIDLIRMLDDLQLTLKQQSTDRLTASSPLFAPHSPCSIPFPSPWSNATILLPARVLPSMNNSINEDGSINVQVIILTPLTQETIPCASLLSSSDCYTQNCNYSHGYNIKADWLLPIETMDIYNKERHYHPNSTVLCKFDHAFGDNPLTTNDDRHIWNKATLLSLMIDTAGQHQWHVSMENGVTGMVGENQVIPLIYLDEDPTTMDGDYDDEVLGNCGSENEGVTEALDKVSDTKRGANNNSFGAWQSHTSGFGEKMMKKMGYVQGKGLGTSGQGRLEPVEAYDKGSQYSQSKRPGLGSLEKKKKAKMKANTSINRDVAGTSSMFDIMNTILEQNHDNTTDDDRSTQHQRPNGGIDSKGSNDSTSKTPKQRNQRRLWQLQDNMDQLEKEWRQGMAAVKRNKGTSMEREFQANVNTLTRQLKSVKQEIALVQGSLTRTKNYEKMTTF